jgi:hypothetical protein
MHHQILTLSKFVPIANTSNITKKTSKIELYSQLLKPNVNVVIQLELFLPGVYIHTPTFNINPFGQLFQKINKFVSSDQIYYSLTH